MVTGYLFKAGDIYEIRGTNTQYQKIHQGKDNRQVEAVNQESGYSLLWTEGYWNF